MSRLLLDVMGGDHGPKAALDGALLALPGLTRPLALLGDPAVIRKHRIYRRLGTGANPRIEVIDAPDTIEMLDKIKALRAKPHASINVGTRLAAESFAAYRAGQGTPDAFVSAGHSGAIMASALLTMGRLHGVERPAIAARLPTANGQGVTLLDAGANVDCKPEHLRDFAIMGALCAQSGPAGKKRPKIALLANGEEKSKGNELSRAVFALLDGAPFFTGEGALGQFVGNCESKEMFAGDVDVVVVDGFIGNLILKNSEAVATLIGKMLKSEAKQRPLALLGFALARGALGAFRKKTDYRETGGAPLLGVQGYAFIAHGRSDAHAIKNALLRAQEALDAKLVERLETELRKLNPPGDGAGK